MSPIMRFLSHSVFGCCLLIGFILVQVSLLKLLMYDGTKKSTPLPSRTHRIDHLIRSGNDLLIERYENRTRDAVNVRKCRKIGEGWSKIVFDCGGVAVKIPNITGKNYRACLEKNVGTSVKFRSELCKRHLIEDLIQDTITITTFERDQMVPELIGYHFPADSTTTDDFQVFLALGSPIDTIRMVNMDWLTRMRVVSNVTDFLLRHPDRHFADLRRQQFVLINQAPALIDYGDISYTANETASSIHHAQRIYDDFIDHFVEVGAPGGIDEAKLSLASSMSRGNATMETIRNFLDEVIK